MSSACRSLWVWAALLILAGMLAITNGPARVSITRAMVSGALQSNEPISTPATIGVTPTAGPAGTVVSLRGSGFSPADTVIVTYAGVRIGVPNLSFTLASIVANADGSLPPTTLTIPPSAAPGSLGMVIAHSTHAITGTDAPTASALFAVTPLTRELTIASSPVRAGTLTFVSGAGFEPNMPVQIALTDSSGEQIAASYPVTSTASGAIFAVGVNVPSTARAGLGTANAIDSNGDVAGIPIIIQPASDNKDLLIVRPIQAALGATVSVAAGGFQPGEPVALTLVGADGTAVSVPGASPLFAGNDGHLQSAFTLPIVQSVTRAGSPAGDNTGTLLTVVIRGALSNTTQTTPLLVAGTSLEVSPRTTVEGLPYTTVGTGFQAGETIAVTLTDVVGTVIRLGSAQASANGIFSLTGAAPAPGIKRATTPNAAASAIYMITAAGQSSGLTATARLITKPAPTLLLRPYVIAPGHTILVQGTSFAVRATVTLTAGGDASRTWLSVLLAKTDLNGAFSAAITIPVTSTLGPITIDAHDAIGNRASTIAEVNDQPPTLQVYARVIPLGGLITVRGSNFGANEAVDIFLAQPSSMPSALPATTVPVATDTQGSFLVSYPLPSMLPLVPAAYLLGAIGETSGRQGITAITIIRVATRPPAPTPTPQPRSTGPCTGTSVVNQNNSVSYFVDGSSETIHLHATRTLSIDDELQVMNAGDQPAAITIAYLLYPGEVQTRASGPNGARRYGFSLAPHSVVARTIRADLGTGRFASIIVRADLAGCASCTPGDCDAVRAVLVTHRTLVTQGIKHTTAPTRLVLDAAITSGVRSAAGTTQTGHEGPSRNWIFAEGYTGAGFHEYLRLLDPETNAARLGITFLSAQGPLHGTLYLTIAPFARQSVDVRAAALRLLDCPARLPTGTLSTRLRACRLLINGESLSLVLTSNVPILAERALYWAGSMGPDATGYDLASGPNVPASQQYFAYASTLGADQAYLSIVNPATCIGTRIHSRCATARIQLRVLTGFGTQAGTTQISLAPQNHLTIPITSLVASGIYTLSLHSSVPVVSELAQYVGGAPVTTAGGHPGFDLPGSQPTVTISGSGFEARDGSPTVRVLNPTNQRIVARVAAIGTAGIYFQRSYQIAASAALALLLPTPPTKPATTRARNTPLAPFGVQVTCGGACIGVALLGVHTEYRQRSTTPTEVWGSELH